MQSIFFLNLGSENLCFYALHKNLEKQSLKEKKLSAFFIFYKIKNHSKL